ncbi:MAG: SBBP repeat-containing protein, partial [Labilithrix sp.]|nr:SBBP repeat-containing protein [Labilithrix sp.]
TYVTGSTSAAGFPVANAYDPTYNPYYECAICGYRDVFVSKLDPTGTTLVYSTYFGGIDHDDATGIAIAADGTAYVTGTTRSYDLPNVNGINPYRGWSGSDGFVARFSADGATLAYSTFLSAYGPVEPAAIAVDATGIYVAGSSTATSVGMGGGIERKGPIPQGGATGGEDYDAFVVKLRLPAQQLDDEPILWVSYLGGTGEDFATGLAVDAAGRAHLTGYTNAAFPQSGGSLLKAECEGNMESADAFVARLNAAGTAFDYAKCFGGSSDDRALAIALDTSGNVYVTGDTDSGDFPAPSSIYPYAGQRDVFVTKLNAAATAILYSTFIGGSNDDHGYAIAVDAANTAWVTGRTRITQGTSYPTVIPAQANHAGGGEGGYDAFVSRVNAAGTALIFSTFYGGGNSDEGDAIAINGSNVYLGGTSWSNDLPFLNGRQLTNGGENDGFIVKLGVPPLLIAPTSVNLNVGQSRQFTATGGAGIGYVFSLQTNNSGGSVSAGGAYTAGNNGGTVDTVRVTDGAGVTATATVRVGQPTTALVISPSNASAPPRGQRSFTASGGVAPYTFSLLSNASGGSVSASGSYTAGTKGGVVDVVRLSDSGGNAVTATVSVGPGISVTPAQPAAPPNGSVSFAATGGSGAGYTWDITQNGSSGTIVAGTGAYTAGNGTNTVDTVRVTDSLGNRASVNVSVGGGLAITPASPLTAPRGAIAFTAVGGSGSYSWSVDVAASGGTINAASGAYTAGPTGDTIDTVRVADSVGNSSTVQIAVGPSLTVTPAGASVIAGESLTFGAAGGSGEGYGFTLSTNESGAAVGADGVYTAGAAAGSDVVTLNDSLGSTAQATITVASAPDTLPDGGTTPGFDAGTIPGLNLGGGGVDEDCSCRAVGASSGGASGASGAAGGIAGLAALLGVVRRRRRR